MNDSCRIMGPTHIVGHFIVCPQGFASGDMDRDAAALRYFVDEGHTVLLAQVGSPTEVLEYSEILFVQSTRHLNHQLCRALRRTWAYMVRGPAPSLCSARIKKRQPGWNHRSRSLSGQHHLPLKLLSKSYILNNYWCALIFVESCKFSRPLYSNPPRHGARIAAEVNNFL